MSSIGSPDYNPYGNDIQGAEDAYWEREVVRPLPVADPRSREEAAEALTAALNYRKGQSSKADNLEPNRRKGNGGTLPRDKGKPLVTPKDLDDKAEAFSAALDGFLAQSNHGNEAWLAFIRPALEPYFYAELALENDRLKRRGLPVLSEEDQKLVVAQTLAASDDIRKALLASWKRDDGPVVAALSLRGFLSPKRIALTVKSLVDSVRDRGTRRVAKKAADDPTSRFTGRKRFRAAEGSARHKDADGQIRNFDEPFSLGERTIGGRRLPAKEFMWARDDPTDVEEWSNSTSYVELEYEKEDGTYEWR